MEKNKAHIVRIAADLASLTYFGEGPEESIPNPRRIDGKPGIVIGERFIPYEDLGFSSGLGLYSLSERPEEVNLSLPFAAEAPILSLGHVVITRGIEVALEEAGKSPEYLFPFLERYAGGDWGKGGKWRELLESMTDREIALGALVCEEDGKANTSAALGGINRILAVFESPELGEFWIITEANRAVTTILYPEEY